MSKKLSSGQTAPLIIAQGLHSDEVRVPDSSGRVTHLQFRRFAGCPVCHVHLQSFVRKFEELQRAGIREVVVFHSSRDRFQPYQTYYPFEVICDPEKKLYLEFGVECSISAVFSWATWKAAFQGMFLPGQPKYVPPPEGGRLGLPADFLLAPDGTIIDCHYGQHSYDQWSVDDVLTRASSVSV